MTTEIRFLTGPKRTAQIGQMVEVAFQVTVDGQPQSEADVTITCDYPDHVLFKGGKNYAYRQTGDAGIGTFKVHLTQPIENAAGDPHVKIEVRAGDGTTAVMRLEYEPSGALAQVPGGVVVQGADGHINVIHAPAPAPQPAPAQPQPMPVRVVTIR